MPTQDRRRRAGWGVVVLTVVFAAAAFVVLFRPLGKGGGAARPAAPPRVNVARLDEGAADQLLREQATIFDPTPLFLPTRWNASQRPLPASVQRQPEQVFGDFAPKLIYGEAELSLPISASQTLPKDPLDLLKQASRDPFLGFGRQDEPLTPLPERLGWVEVQRVGDGHPMLRCKLERPVVLPAGRLDWRPAEFLVTVTVAGLLGRPVGTASSDIEEVDLFLRDYLSEVLHLGERLPPGMYRVVVGP
jgi:hypothetical protein